uniref:Uncharacterized protein n=1 Tax=Fagus sylvatica TaxID=28930 RepID=A0A2N9IGX3_FAGSY
MRESAGVILEADLWHIELVSRVLVAIHARCLENVQECDKCQRFAPMIPSQLGKNPLSSLAVCSMGFGIVGPLPRAPGNKKFLIETILPNGRPSHIETDTNVSSEALSHDSAYGLSSRITG